MRKFFNSILSGIYNKFRSILIYISIGLYNTEIEILKADPNDLNSKNDKNQRVRHKNQVLENFYAGQTDEKYVQDYYDILKKGDRFMRNATVREKAIAAHKFGMDHSKDGGEYSSHFDEKHKHAGKKLIDVLDIEMDERRSTDDDYKLLDIFDNKPIDGGLSKIDDVVDTKYSLTDIQNKSKTVEFPIKIFRNDKIVNKIEELTESLHVKKIGFEHRQLEFFIPKKYKTSEIKNDDSIFNDLVNVGEVYIDNGYGELIAYRIDKFVKRINNDTHEIWKFDGIEMRIIIK